MLGDLFSDPLTWVLLYLAVGVVVMAVEWHLRGERSLVASATGGPLPGFPERAFRVLTVVLYGLAIVVGVIGWPFILFTMIRLAIKTRTETER